MAANPIVIFGTGADARIALDIFNSNDVLVFGFVARESEKIGTAINDVAVFGKTDDENARKVLKGESVDYFIAEGEISVRKKLQTSLAKLTGRPAVNAVHSTAVVSQYAKIGFGNFVNAGVVINPNAEIGDMNFFHSVVSVEPDTKIGNFCNFGSGVRIGGNVTIEDNVFVGTGAIIYPGVKVGQGAIIGAGAVVLRSVDGGTTVFGNPAQKA